MTALPIAIACSTTTRSARRRRPPATARERSTLERAGSLRAPPAFRSRQLGAAAGALADQPRQIAVACGVCGTEEQQPQVRRSLDRVGSMLEGNLADAGVGRR